MLSVVMLSVIMLSINMLSVIMLGVIMLSVIMLNVVAPQIRFTQNPRDEDLFCGQNYAVKVSY